MIFRKIFFFKVTFWLNWLLSLFSWTICLEIKVFDTKK